MEIEKAIKDLKPLGGQVIPIRTVQETRPVEEFGMTYYIGDDGEVFLFFFFFFGSRLVNL